MFGATGLNESAQLLGYRSVPVSVIIRDYTYTEWTFHNPSIDAFAVVAMQTVWLARHGNRLDFVDPHWFRYADNPYDPPLAPDGVQQAKQLAERLQGEGIEALFASPFLRAVETAHHVAESLNLPIYIEPGLCEWLNPEWFAHRPSVLPSAELARRFPRVDAGYRAIVEPAYPETWEEVQARTATTITALVRDQRQILVVGHGASVVGCTWGLVGDRPAIYADYCALVKLVLSEQCWHVELAGDTTHIGLRSDSLHFG